MDTTKTVPAGTEIKQGSVVKVRVGPARDGLGRWVSLLLDSSFQSSFRFLARIH
jgi:hypothetical protein